MIEEEYKQLTIKESLSKKCLIWNHCDYHTCNRKGGCEAYHDPHKTY